VGVRRGNTEGKRGKIWWMYFVYVYENGTMQLVEIILRSGEEG
jgi:hypothetical protein